MLRARAEAVTYDQEVQWSPRVQWFPRESGVLASGDGSDPRGRLLHAGTMPSTTPIAVGLIALLIGLWLLSAAVNNPLALVSEADGADVRGGDEPVHVAFPPGLTGEVDVLTQHALPTASTDVDGFAVVNAAGHSVAQGRTRRIPVYVGRGDESHRLTMTLDLPVDHELTLVVPAGWNGHVAFIHHDNPPFVADWRRIIEGVVVAGMGGAIAAVWWLRRRKWQQNLAVIKADLAASGYDVD